MSSTTETQSVQTTTPAKKTRAKKSTTTKTPRKKAEASDKPKTPRVRKPKAPKPAPAEGEAAAPKVPKEKKKRVPVTKEMVKEAFEELHNTIKGQIDHLATMRKEGKKEGVGSKVLRSLNKKVSMLEKNVERFLMTRRKKKERTVKNASSGFSKKMGLTDEMKAFAGPDVTDLDCRQKVTKFLCKYIKDHNLQDPNKKTNILIEKDPKLAAVLRYSEPVLNKESGKMEVPPMSYTALQRYIGRLLVKLPPQPVSAQPVTPQVTTSATPAPTVSTSTPAPTPTAAAPVKVKKVAAKKAVSEPSDD